MIKSINILFVLILLSFNLSAQSSTGSQNNYLHHLVDRISISSGIEPRFHSAFKYYNIKDVVEYSKIILDSTGDINNRDFNDIEYILSDNFDWLKYVFSDEVNEELQLSLFKNHKGFLKYLYKSPSSFFATHQKDFFIKVDPVIYFRLGKDFQNENNEFTNTRGFKISGLLNNKIYFYTSFFETQQTYLPHIERRIERDLAVPGEGFYKKYESSVLDGVEGYDFSNAQAFIGFNLTKNLSAQLGHGKFFIGNGIRSLFLSDYSHNYYYLKFDTRIWKFHYQNIFAELAGISSKQLNGDILLPKKYMAAHYLSLKLFKNFEIGLFENVIFSRKNHFELQYLNPVIIYRTVEHFVGSPDNVVVGIEWKYNFLMRFSFYGQFVLDEFNFSILKEDNSWWANKYGFQAGLKYINVFGINHLDFQLESNILRPYTYAHRDSISTYSHFNQPLAHPLGANFKELLFLVKYSPIDKLFIKAKAAISNHGEDLNERSWGGNILRSDQERPLDDEGNLQDFDYYIGNGLNRNTSQYSLNMSYMFYHNFWFDIDAIYRKEISDNALLNSEEFYIGCGLRINMNSKFMDY